MKGKISALRLLGVLLIAASACLLAVSHFHSRAAKQKAAETFRTLEELIPPRTPGIPGLYAESEMAVLEVEGQDYLALLEIPSRGVRLPVGSRWSRTALFSHPCRFQGSVHDSSLVIGGAAQDGQFDFCEQLAIGDLVIVTDMTGAEFRYRVSHIGRNAQADPAWLCQEEYDLTLFARTELSLEYIAVRCTLCSG